jgi:hypothetical protein
MNLNAKLYILKNYTLLLLGPSPFEHWCESYLCFTVGSLLFSKIAFGSSFVYLSPPPLLLLCRTPPPLPSHVHRPAALRRPSTRRPTPLPTARAASPVLPSPCHIGPPEPSSCHASEGTAGAARRLEPDPVTTPPLPLFYEVMCCYKTDPNPFPSPVLVFFLLATPSPPPHFLAGIHLDRATPSKSPRPTASPPSPLTPRPDPVQLPALLRRNRPHPVPPLTGAARARSHRRRPTSTASSAN